MKKYILALFIIFITALSAAQTTTVTATVTAPDGQVFANGTVTAVFNPPGGITQQSQYKLNGNTFPYFVTGSMDGSGTFTIVLTDDHAVRPFGGRWQFQVCPNVSISCTQSIQDVFGASINLSTLISTDVKNFNGISLNLPRFYADGEASASSLGGQLYFNWVSKSVRLFDSSGWVDLAGTGGGSFVAKVPSVSQVVQPDAAHSTIIPLTLQCPLGAAAGLRCARILDSAGNEIGGWTQSGAATIPILNGTVYCAIPVTDLGATLTAAQQIYITSGSPGLVDCSSIGPAVNMSTSFTSSLQGMSYRFGVVTVSATSNTAVFGITAKNTHFYGSGPGETIFNFSAQTSTGNSAVVLVGNAALQADGSRIHSFSIIGNRITVCNPGGLNNFCNTGANDLHHGITGIKVATTAPVTQKDVKVYDVSILNAGFIGLQIDNCIYCEAYQNFITQSWSSGIQINSSQSTVAGVYGGNYHDNFIQDGNVGCGVLATSTGQNCGDGIFNLISGGTYGALGATKVAFNTVINTVTPCNDPLVLPVGLGGIGCSWDNTKYCGGGLTNDTGCGQGVQAVYKANKGILMGNLILHTSHEGAAVTSGWTVVGNDIEDNACCAGGAGPLVFYVDPQGILTGASATGNILKDGGYGISMQLGATGVATDSAVINGLTITGNDIEGTGAGGTSIVSGIRFVNNCTGCVTHNTTMDHVIVSGNTLHGAITNPFVQMDPTKIGSGVAYFYNNSPNVHTGSVNSVNLGVSRTNFSVISNSTTKIAKLQKGTWRSCYTFAVHTAGAAGTTTLTFNYTDENNHAKTISGGSVDDTSTTVTGLSTGCFTAKLDPANGSTDILYSVGGALGAGTTYDIYIDTDPVAQTN